ncbi:MFS transporter [Micromonospora sp. NPDC000316]|uniref:MFS transporter n=1 Tax=Micromonospora sp. NPDC000316 TaxID=3364216 RepID=UPI003687C5BC
MRELLRDKIYVRYWLAVVTSFLGDGIARIAVLFVAADLTDAPALFIAAVVVAQMLPSGVLGAFIGPLVDRLSPRVLLVGADLARVVIVLVMITAVNSAWLLLVLIFLEGLGKAVFETARMAAIPKVVGGHSIPVAIALFQSTVQTLNLIGPLIGGLLIALTGVRLSLVVNALTFAVSAILLGSIAVLKEATVTAAGPGQYWSSLRTGVTGVLSIRSLRLVAWAMIPVMLAIGLFTTNVNTQLLTEFELPAFEFGLTQAMLGGGAIIGAIFGPVLVQRYSLIGLLAGAVGLFAVSLVVLWPIDHNWPGGGVTVVAGWCALAGLGMSLVQVPVANILLRDLPEELRGRGIALLNSVMVNFVIIGVLVGGVVASEIGVAASIVLTGVALVPAALVLGAKSRTRQPGMDDERRQWRVTR